jgi:hypothetical protein
LPLLARRARFARRAKSTQSDFPSRVAKQSNQRSAGHARPAVAAL